MLAAGFVRSFSHPGDNISGVSILGADLNGKRLEVLMEAMPSARNIAILADPNNTPPAELKALQNAARGRGVEVAVLTAGTPEQIAPAMDKAKAAIKAAFAVCAQQSSSSATSGSGCPQDAGLQQQVSGQWQLVGDPTQALTVGLDQNQNVAALGRSLFTDYLLPVELAAMLLLVATVGAIAIAGRRAEGLR